MEVLTIDGRLLVILGLVEHLLAHLVIQQELQDILVIEVTLGVEGYGQSVHDWEVLDLEDQGVALVEFDVLFLGGWLVDLHLDLGGEEGVLARSGGLLALDQLYRHVFLFELVFTCH